MPHTFDPSYASHRIPAFAGMTMFEVMRFTPRTRGFFSPILSIQKPIRYQFLTSALTAYGHGAPSAALFQMRS